MNSPFCQLALWLAALGSATVGGVFFAFSTFVMTALRQLPAPQALAAMQAINRNVLSSLFLAVFMITAAVSVGVGVIALLKREPGAWPAFAGAVFYVLGSFTVTAACNVPLNELLATLNPTQLSSAASWSDYARTWTAWNHVRTVACMLAFAGFTLALRATAHSEAQP